MADDSWYRRRTWSREDQAAFFDRLKRSRSGFHKAQYCRIQAYELQQAGYFNDAIGLLDYLMAEWPHDAELAVIYHQKAACLERLGDKTAALAAYRQAFDAQRKKPSVLTNAHLGFALLAASTPFPNCYDEALSVLNEFRMHSPFPIQEFEAAAARALIADARAEREEAKRQAATALEAATREHSGFSRHANVGLVKNVGEGLMGRLRRIVEN